MGKIIHAGNVKIGGKQPLVLIAGPCVIENRDHCLGLARRLRAMSRKYGIPLVFKASYDKANRTSHRSYRGPGLEAGLQILAEVRDRYELTLLTDISQLDVQFNVRELGDDSGLALLELRSQNPESQFERVLLGLEDDKVLLMAMEDAFGLRTEIRFKDIQRNPQLNEELFHFTPPDGVDVIGDF